MKGHNRKYSKNTPDNLKRLGSMNAFLIPDVVNLNDSGFSLELTEDELNEVFELFNRLEELDEEDS